MRDDLEFNIHFVELVQSKPCSYDYNRCSALTQFLQFILFLVILDNIFLDADRGLLSADVCEFGFSDHKGQLIEFVVCKSEGYEECKDSV